MSPPTKPSPLEVLAEELIVIRGPWPLERGKPVDAGALGALDERIKGVEGTVSGTRKTLWKIALVLASAVLSGAGGTYIAFRDRLVEQGREEEKARARVLHEMWQDTQIKALAEKCELLLTPP